LMDMAQWPPRPPSFKILGDAAATSSLSSYSSLTSAVAPASSLKNKSEEKEVEKEVKKRTEKEVVDGKEEGSIFVAEAVSAPAVGKKETTRVVEVHDKKLGQMALRFLSQTCIQHNIAIFM